MRACAAAIAALVVALALAAPAEAATRMEAQAAAFAVPTPAVPVRDIVIEHPSRAQARALASTAGARYDVHDGAGRSVDIRVSTLCSVSCTDADPQVIADFLGTLPHGDEMNLLVVDLVWPPEMSSPQNCGSVNALSCYIPSQNRMVVRGDDFTASDNATRAYVIAHEYGHHLANHRDNSPFDHPAINWGPKNWASYEGVCPGVRSGRYFPGNEGSHYYQNPGEAFAESFAKNRFPQDPVPWEWPDFPAPGPGAFAAIRADALHPWNGDVADERHGRFGKKRHGRHGKKRHLRKRIVARFVTPLDGDLTLKLIGADRARLALKLKDSDGRTLLRSNGPGSHEQLSFRICGERELTAVVRRHSRKKSRFNLTALLP